LANAKRGNSSSGCGALIALAIVVGLIALVVSVVAEAVTDLAIWMQYGSNGIPSTDERSVAYPLAWSLVLAVLALIGAGLGATRYERSRRRKFEAYIAQLRPPTREDTTQMRGT
jgi:uncharacterized membrane protein YphA (DoxX/SURF4 family)